MSPPTRSALADFARRTLVSGTCASIASVIALAFRGWKDERSLLAPLNGPSQWLWGEREAYTREVTLRHTAVGYAIHHASALLWAGVHEALEPHHPASESTGRILARSAAVTTLAFVVDYGLTPRRLRPGFRKHIRSSSLLFVYGSFALGLASATLTRRQRSRLRNR